MIIQFYKFEELEVNKKKKKKSVSKQGYLFVKWED